jgi:hypothetical protein
MFCPTRARRTHEFVVEGENLRMARALNFYFDYKLFGTYSEFLEKQTESVSEKII